MSKYTMGRDIGDLLCRVAMLEDRIARLEAVGDGCGCDDAPGDGERTARALTDKEIKKLEDGGKKQQAAYCEYVVTGFYGPRCPGISINDSLCISPCPTCPNLRRINLVTANGTAMCSVQVIRVV